MCVTLFPPLLACLLFGEEEDRHQQLRGKVLL